MNVGVQVTSPVMFDSVIGLSVEPDMLPPVQDQLVNV